MVFESMTDEGRLLQSDMVLGNSCICKNLLTLSLDEISKGDILGFIIFWKENRGS